MNTRNYPKEIMQEAAPDILLSEGNWNSRCSWDFHLSCSEPDPSKTSAVFVLPINPFGNFALTKGKRGWEIPGGHVDKGETIRGAMKRECLEESGVTLDAFTFIGYQKLRNKEMIPNPSGGFYPFPFGYIAYFVGTFSREQEPIADDGVTTETGIFSKQEIIELKKTNRGVSLLLQILEHKNFPEIEKSLRM